MSEINASQMSRETLKETAADLGIEFADNIPTDKLVERVKAHLGEPTPEITDGPDLTQRGQTRFEITVATDSVDKQPVYVSVNGHNYVIRRGEKVIVPGYVVEALSHAVKYVYDSTTMERQEVLSYPFQIIREVAA